MATVLRPPWEMLIVLVMVPETKDSWAERLPVVVLGSTVMTASTCPPVPAGGVTTSQDDRALVSENETLQSVAEVKAMFQSPPAASAEMPELSRDAPSPEKLRSGACSLPPCSQPAIISAAAARTVNSVILFIILCYLIISVSGTAWKRMLAFELS